MGKGTFSFNKVLSDATSMVFTCDTCGKDVTLRKEVNESPRSFCDKGFFLMLGLGYSCPHCEKMKKREAVQLDLFPPSQPA